MAKNKYEYGGASEYLQYHKEMKRKGLRPQAFGVWKTTRRGLRSMTGDITGRTMRESGYLPPELAKDINKMLKRK